MKFELRKEDGPSDVPLLFVSRLIDDCRFTVSQFRVLGHITRRGGTFSMNGASYGCCRRGLRDIAKACGIAINTVSKTLAQLVAWKVLERAGRCYPGEPFHYQVARFNRWDLEAIGPLELKVTEEDSRSESAMLFVHSDIDEFGFTPHQFRILAHIARRGSTFSKYGGSGNPCREGLRSMARVCRMSIDTARRTLAELVELNMLERTWPRGRAYADFYRVNAMNQWHRPYQTDAQKDIPKGTDPNRREYVRAPLGAVLALVNRIPVPPFVARHAGSTP